MIEHTNQHGDILIVLPAGHGLLRLIVTRKRSGRKQSAITFRTPYLEKFLIKKMTEDDVNDVIPLLKKIKNERPDKWSFVTRAQRIAKGREPNSSGLPRPIETYRRKSKR